MKTLSDTLNELIVLAEEAITRPHVARSPGFLHRLSHIAAAVRSADARPADGVRTTRAAMIMVIAMEAAAAGDAAAPWRMLIAASLELVRADAYQELTNVKERRG